MAFVLPPLPYDPSALDPVISAETFEYHHGKHHNAYVTKTNELVEKGGLQGKSLVEVVAHAKQAGDKPLFNNAAQVWNHSFYWHGLSPEKQTPTGALATKITDAFGSTEAMLTQFAAESVGHFASGWGWLVLDDGTLRITSYHDADTPIAYGVTPLFTLDVWEHAYYVDYRNARPKYAEAVLNNNVNWAFVAQNLDGQGVSRADQAG